MELNIQDMYFILLILKLFQRNKVINAWYLQYQGKYG